MHIASVIWLVFRSPYESRVDKIINGLMEVSSLVTFAITYIFVIDNKRQAFTEGFKTNLGWVMIGFCVMTIAVSLLIMIFENIMGIVSLIKKLRNK